MTDSLVPPEAMQLATTLAKSDLIPRALKGKPGDVLVILLTGRELGLGPMQSLRGINVIDGKAVLSADLIVGLCVSRPTICEWFRLVESDARHAKYATKRAGAPAPQELEWTLDQARAAGLVGKQNWAKYPDAMLRARCASALARAVYPDLMAGCYDPDEMGKEEAPAPTHEVKDIEARREEAPALPSAAPVAAPVPPKVEAPRQTVAKRLVIGDGPPEEAAETPGERLKRTSEEEAQATLKFGDKASPPLPKGKRLKELTEDELVRAEAVGAAAMAGNRLHASTKAAVERNLVEIRREWKARNWDENNS